MIYVIQNIKTNEYYSENGWRKDVEKARIFKERSHVKLFVTHNKWFKLDDVETTTFNLTIAKEQDDVIKEIKNKQLLNEIEKKPY